MKVLVIDNYDSFTYNLVHDLERDSNLNVDVVRNDQVNEIDWHAYDRVVLSPGPGLPDESAGLMQALAELEPLNIPVFGICLGLQAMVEHTGGQLYNLEMVRHGEPGSIHLNSSCALFKGLAPSTEVGLYHSWAADEKHLPDTWKIEARSEDEVIMCIEHRELPWIAVQFHPESVLSGDGRKMLKNWIQYYS